MSTWYCTREDVRASLDTESAARSDAQLDRAIAAGTTAVTSLCQRSLAPVLDTRYKDWPSTQTPLSWRVWLDRDEVISVTQVTTAGIVIPDTDYYLEPVNSGPPYNRIETRLDRPSAWQSGETHQHAVAVMGWFGHSDNQAPAGALVGAIDAATTAVTVSDSSALGVGSLLRAGTERMTVTGKRLADTGQTVLVALTALNNDVLVQVPDGAGFHEGEVITAGAERMEITDIAGDTLTVKRAQAGSIITAHPEASPIYAPRLLAVARGAAGTTAATAADGALLTCWVPPALANSLTVAEAISDLYQKQSGMLRTTGGGRSAGVESTLAGLKDLRDQVAASDLCRKTRMRAV